MLTKQCQQTASAGAVNHAPHTLPRPMYTLLMLNQVCMSVRGGQVVTCKVNTQCTASWVCTYLWLALVRLHRVGAAEDLTLGGA